MLALLIVVLVAGVTGGPLGAARVASLARACPLALAHAPRVERFTIGTLCLAVLRDDETVLLGTCGLVRGNKARKFAALPTDRSLVSYGGVQSNAAAALAALARARGVSCHYFVRGQVAAHLKAAPSGNYAALLERGATLVELDRAEGGYDALRAYAEGHAGAARPPFVPSDALLVPQGGACAYAQHGLQQLAAHVDECARAAPNVRTVALICAGTGASALFLARHTREAAAVVALPCAMGAAAMDAELLALHLRTPGGLAQQSEPPLLARAPRVPLVLASGIDGAVRFGALDEGALAAWRLARAAGLRLDLLYGAVGLAQLLRAATQPGGVEAALEALLGDEQQADARPLSLLWVHTGGLEGVPSQLARYVRKGIATADELAAAQAEADISDTGLVYGKGS